MGNPISRDSIAWLGAATRAEAITPDDVETFAATRGIVSTDGGAAVLAFADGGDDLTITLAPDVVYPFSIVAVRETSTIATEIFALY